MSVIYAGVFVILWRYRRQSPYLLVLAGCYAALALCFILQVVTLPVGEALTRALANLFALISMTCLAYAFCQRCEVRFPREIFGGVMAVTYGVLLWFLYVEPDVVTRIYAINSGIAVLMLVTAFATFRSGRNLADRIMTVLLVAYAVLSVVRPILTLPMDRLAPGDGIAMSTYWMILGFTHAILSLLMVFALTTAMAIDAMRELRDATFTDPLSGLLNRRGFESAVAKKMEWASARRLPLALVICDLDHFKSINDTFGHHIGDQVIGTFARVMKDVAGDAHVVGRIGGEEFAIMVAGGDASVAELIAQGIRVGFSAASPPGSKLDGSHQLTASFGIAERLPDETYEDLLGRADAALYDAKGAGRDCVRIAGNRQVARAGSTVSASGAPGRRYRDSSS